MAAHQLMVAVRIRPLNEAEKERNAYESVSVIDEQRLLLVDPEKYSDFVLRANRQFEREFTFDTVFSPNSSNNELHQKMTAPLLDQLLNGTDATVFAYGPTGTGKTFTMMGTRQIPGLMPLLLSSLYQRIEALSITLYISFMELYNEVIRDLLSPKGGALELLEDNKGNVHVPGLQRIKAPNVNTLRSLLHAGNQRRIQEPTKANATSSRSHALLQVQLFRKPSSGPEKLVSKLYLIDLAGSERASHTENRGQRLKEGASINRSLLALGNVINALSVGSRGQYINYRDSKLTRLLKDSLSGGGRTCMIVHISPSSIHYDETYNTLLYANRAKSINTRFAARPRPSSADQPYHLALEELRKENTKRANRGSIPQSQSMNKLNQLDQEKEQKMPKLPPLVANTARSTNNVNAASTRVKKPSQKLPPANISTASSSTVSTPSQRRRSNDSVYDSLRKQFLAAFDRQQKLFDQLLTANQESYELELYRASKLAIVEEWEKRRLLQFEDKFDEDRCGEIVVLIRRELSEKEQRLQQLADLRKDIESSIRKEMQTITSLETRIRRQTKDPDQLQVIELIRTLSLNQTEKIAMKSDLALQNLRIQRQEATLAKLQRYEQIADRLISDQHLTETERDYLRKEYRTIRTQLNFHLLPLANENLRAVPSWNSQVVSQVVRRHSGSPTRNTMPKIELIHRISPSSNDISTSEINIENILPLLPGVESDKESGISA